MRVLAIGRDRIFTEMISQLAADKEINIVNWVSDRNQDAPAMLQNRIIDRIQFMDRKKILGLTAGRNCSLSEGELKDMLECEHVFFAISDRWSNHLSSWERRRLYHNLLLYWRDYLIDQRIEAVLFQYVPHSGWDNVVYYLARRMGVKTLIRENTQLRDRIIYLSRYDKIEKTPSTFKSEESLEELKAGLSDELKEDFFQEASGLRISKGMMQEARSPVYVNYLVKHLVRVGIGFGKYLSRVIQQKTPQGLYPFDRPQNEVVLEIERFRRISKQFNLKSYYESISVKADVSRKFVFFALHYQPESSTTPAGGIYQDQILAIRTLAESIPDDWVLYVKEHPYQFAPLELNAMFRDEVFYENIRSVPKVQIIDLNQGSSELIDKAQFVSTITGSAGWESMQKGTPCLVFATPWYSGCNSCYVVNSPEACRDAIKLIAEKDADQVKADVLRYIMYFEKRFLISNINYGYSKVSERKYVDFIRNEKETIRDILLENAKVTM